MFDISKLDFKTPSESGAFMGFFNPATGEVARDGHGKEIGVTLVGRYSDAFFKGRQELDLKRVAVIAAGGKMEQDEEIAFIIAACTKDWTWSHMDDAEFPCTPENAQKFWADPRFRVYRDAAFVFINDMGNFTKR